MSLNIYILDNDPTLAAEAMSDHHVARAYAMAAAVLRTAHAMRTGQSLQGLDGPRHPITRYAARSPEFVEWVCKYGVAAAREAWWRGIVDKSTSGAMTELEILGEWLGGDTDACDVVGKRRLSFVADGGSDVDAGLSGAPQRLDGRPDLALPSDPVTAYRRWYTVTKLGGGPGTWQGQASGWTRRLPPSWLGDHAPAGYAVRIDVLPHIGVGLSTSQTIGHETHVASLVPLDSASRAM